MFNPLDLLNPEWTEQSSPLLWSEISPLYAVDETSWLGKIMPLAKPDAEHLTSAESLATRLIEEVRADGDSIHMIDALLLEYSLDTEEGILLMCLAEALMRIPDKATADALIRDKLSVADWKKHLQNSDSLFVNASTWGLLLTGKVVSLHDQENTSASGALNRMVNRLSEPVIRRAMQQAMQIMGHQFVLGRDISEAWKRGEDYRNKGYTYSFDMLGEAALTRADAQKYYESYLKAIEYTGKFTQSTAKTPKPSVSIKLSALHPRYEVGQSQRVLTELYATVINLIKVARAANVAITIDAEEMDRLELSLMLFEKLYQSPEVKGWGGLGLVVQAYSKRALAVLAWLASLAKAQGDIIPLRLVKGAYWDSEIKLCQQKGLLGYPVWTRKEATDVSYLACARFLLSEHIRGFIWPQFASHNAHTIASILTLTTHKDFEFQRLHGMGDALYDRVIKSTGTHVRIYAPVGSHKDLLPYLVRRLLENGANSSFVHRLVDARCPISELVQHPYSLLSQRSPLHNPNIPLPTAIFTDRLNSSGPNIDIASQWDPFYAEIQTHITQQWTAQPFIDGQPVNELSSHPVLAPHDRRITIGDARFATPALVEHAFTVAKKGYELWHTTPVEERAAALNRLADLLESNLAELCAICHMEAGKTLQDSIDEVREAVDFCRFYANEALRSCSKTLPFIDLQGHQRHWSRQGRGIIVCISPWNFPLAIFLGQISAALAAGNSVIAKPAEQTSIIASKASELIYAAGIPGAAFTLLPGNGPTVGAPLTSDPRVSGVAFTGSTETAQRINRSLAQRDCTPSTFIAETGGLNAMIVDSTALPEQVVIDAIHSGFASAGQRCSALRILCVQEDIADRVITLLKGAMSQLVVGDPRLHSTDVGPVIDEQAQSKLLEHIERMKADAHLLAQTPLPVECKWGTFVAPILFEINAIDMLKREEFGPIVHLYRYKAADLDQLIQQLNALGYGLTLGIHSRNENTAAKIERLVQVGNCYINRNQIGAAVGVQPFGGQKLSGTGPKAGGPHYLNRFTQLTWEQPNSNSDFTATLSQQEVSPS